MLAHRLTQGFLTGSASVAILVVPADLDFFEMVDFVFFEDNEESGSSVAFRFFPFAIEYWMCQVAVSG